MHHGTFTPTTFSMEYSFLTSCGSMALFLGQPRHHKTSLRLLLECINANNCFAVTVLKVGIYQSLLKHSVATTFNFFCDIFVESYLFQLFLQSLFFSFQFVYGVHQLHFCHSHLLDLGGGLDFLGQKPPALREGSHWLMLSFWYIHTALVMVFKSR